LKSVNIHVRLIMFKFCPSCASKNITFIEGKVFRCPDCGFVYYHNIAAATGCIIRVPSPYARSENSCPLPSFGSLKTAVNNEDRLLFLVRGKEPAVGKLDLPGGFVDIGEGALEGLCRELHEEIGWTPVIPTGALLSDVFTLFASFSNVYEYKSIKYNTCDIYFSVLAPGLKLEDLHLEQAEVSAALFLKPEEIDFSQFAFSSTLKAVKTYLALSTP